MPHTALAIIMFDSPRPNRPPARTPAALEAELRRRIRDQLAEARDLGEGELSDEALAATIASAIGAALSWHLDQPEHARGLDRITTGGAWRPAPGPRARPRPRPAFEEEEEAEYGEEEEFERPPRRGP